MTKLQHKSTGDQMHEGMQEPLSQTQGLLTMFMDDTGPMLFT